MALSERYSATLDKCLGSLTTWKNFINENLESSDKSAETAKLQVITQEYCIINDNHKRSENAIEMIEQITTDAAQNYNIDVMFNDKLSEQPVEDPTSSEIWEQIISNNISVQEIRPKKKKESTQYEEIDDSLLCSSSFSAPLDPISKKLVHRPVRNIKCKHIYDKDSIYAYVRQSKRKAKCPYVGCKNNHLVVSDLQDDAQLEERITQYLASQENEGESDEDSS